MQTEKSSYEKAALFVLFLFFIVNCIFLFSVSLLPFIDLPNHLAEATIYKFHNAPGNILFTVYQPVPWFYPNTFHPIFCSLFPTVEIGNKAFYVLYIALLQLGLFLTIKKLNGNIWYGLLGLLFTYNYNVTFGFVGFAISIPVLILLFYVILCDIEKETIFLKVIISALLVILFFMHAQNALFGLLLYGLMMLYTHGWAFKKLLIRALLIPLPLVVLIFTWWFSRTDDEPSTSGYMLDYYTSQYIKSLFIRLRLIAFDNFQLQEGILGVAIAALIFSLILVPLLYFKPWKPKLSFQSMKKESVYALIFFSVSLGCYLFLPDKLPGQTPVAQRFCTIVILSFILLGSTWLQNANSQWFRYYVLIAIVGYTAMWFEYIHAFNRENSMFSQEFLTDIDNKTRLGGLMYNNEFRGRKVYIHFPGYNIVWNQGITTSNIIDFRFGVVKRMAPEREVPFYYDLVGTWYRPMPEYNSLDYLLVRGKSPIHEDVNLKVFTLVKEFYPWYLYKHK